MHRGSLEGFLVGCVCLLAAIAHAQQGNARVEADAYVRVAQESNQLQQAESSMRMAEMASSNEVDALAASEALVQAVRPVDRLVPQSEEQRVFTRASGGHYVEIASGLNYQDESGALQPSRVIPKTLGGGAVTFDELPVKHTFAPWSGQRVVVESTRRGGPTAKSALGGLSYYDLTSGRSALIAWVTNVPVQAYDGGVFYEHAFLGVDADILYKVHPWGLEQDVVIFGGLPDPRDFGMDPEQTRLCALTELIDFDLAGAGVTRAGTIAPAEPAVAALEVFVGSRRDWKRIYNWQPGSAYPEYGTLVMGGDKVAGFDRQPVAMRLFSARGRVFLSEEIRVSSVARVLPRLMNTGTDDQVVSIQLIHRDNPIALPPVRPLDGLIAGKAREQGSQASLLPGLHLRGGATPRYVLDYINYSGTSTSNITFISNQTYYISGPLIMSGSKLTIQPGAIVKLAANAYIGLQSGASVDCRSHAAGPAYFTSSYDTNIGEVVQSGASPLSNRYTKGFSISTTSNDVRGLIFNYAGTAIEIAAPGHHRIRDVKMLNSQRGLTVSGASTAEVINALFRDGSDGALLSCAGALFENCTFYKFTNSAVSGITNLTDVAVRNSIFYDLNKAFASNCSMQAIFEGNASYNVATGWMGSSVVTLASNTFEAGLGGSNYLVAGSSAINAGTTNANLVGLYHYTTATNGIKETNSIVDIGFHYPSVQDSDGDQLYDFQEDLTGNGDFDGSGTDFSSWTNSDTDVDGMPDGWEWQYGLNPQVDDASSDLDGDGYSNLTEYQTGCDPASLGSRPSLVADYEFNEASWTGAVNEVVDDSGQTNHGRAVNGAVVTNTAFGSVGDFDGINDNVTVSNSASLQTLGSMSVSFWMKPEVVSWSYFQIMMEKSRYGEWALVTAHGALYWSQGSGAWLGRVLPNDSFIVGKWYHVAVTRDAATRTLKSYVNGVCTYTNIYPSGQAQLPSLSTRALTIGGGSSYSNFDGQLDRVKIYGYVPTSSELIEEYDGDGDGLPRLWEEANGLNPSNGADASIDSDGDGFSNKEEHLSETNPQNSNSTPGYVRADYEFSESSWSGAENEVVDSSGQTNHGRAVNGALVTNTAFGSVGDFDGINDSITASNKPSLQILGSMSLSFWMKPDNLSATYFRMVMEKYRYGEWALSTLSGGLFWYQGVGQWVGLTMPYNSLQTGKWQHVVITRDALTRTLKGYVNGACKITNVYPNTQNQLPYPSTRALTIGGGSTYSNYDGQLERIKIYGWALNPTEIVQETGAGADLLNDPSFGCTISGTVAYAGAQTGLIQIVAAVSSNLWTDSVRRVTISAPGAYVLTNVVKSWNYWVGAYRDANTNLIRDFGEPFGTYTGNSFYVTTNKSGVNVTMLDPDSDQDGLPDWWELANGLNPTSSIPGAGEGWWRFDETSGTNAVNSAGSGYGGQLINMATNAWTSGKLGNALTFDGTNDYVKVPQSPAIITNRQFTVSAWAYLEDLVPDGYPAIMGDMGTDYCGSWYAGFLLAADKSIPGPWAYGGDCQNILLFDYVYSMLDRWTHVVLTDNGTSACLYLDGQLRTTQEAPFSPAQQPELLIGKAILPGGTAMLWQGKLDDMRLYKSVLSSNAVATMYDALADADGDGYSNLQEYQAGANPNQSNQPPIVIITYPNDGGVLP